MRNNERNITRGNDSGATESLREQSTHIVPKRGGGEKQMDNDQDVQMIDDQYKQINTSKQIDNSKQNREGHVTKDIDNSKKTRIRSV